MIEEGQERYESFRVRHRERVVPGGLHEWHCLAVCLREVCVSSPVDWILRRRHVVVDWRLLVRVGSDVVGAGYERVHAHIDGHDFGVVVLFDVKHAKEAGGDADDDAGRAVHVVDPALQRLLVRWNDDCGSENGDWKSFRLILHEILS